MTDQSINHLLIKNSNEDKQSLISPLTDIADSGIVSRITPLSSINDNRLFINPIDDDDDDDDDSISTEIHCPSIDLIDINKPVLLYKICEEYTQYSDCLVTYLDHPSAIFIQTLQDGPAFQQMHQDMNRYYMDNLNAYTTIPNDFFQIGNFCVAYSSRYFEFFRARILNVDRINQQYLIQYVDFGHSEWIHTKSLRPLHSDFAQLKIQSMAVTLSNILPKKDPLTGSINWNTNIGKQCTRKLRRLLIKPDNEPFLFVSVTFLLNENWWPLSFVDMKLDGQDLAEILHRDGFARLTRNNHDLKMIYPTFGTHPNEKLIFGLSKRTGNRYP